jgi:CheY-like chemotaxis protein
VANNGKEAIDLLLKERFDCVLMDVQMPVMDGYEATRLIRAHPKLAGTLIIAMTANAGIDDQRCLAAGMDEFIAKPVAPTLLFNMLARWMRQRPASAQARTASAPSYYALPLQAAPQPGASEDILAQPMFDLAVLAQTSATGLTRCANLRCCSSMRRAMACGTRCRAGPARQRAPGGTRAPHQVLGTGGGRHAFGNLCLALEQVRHDSDPALARQLVQQMHAMLAQLEALMTQELLAYSES